MSIVAKFQHNISNRTEDNLISLFVSRIFKHSMLSLPMRYGGTQFHTQRDYGISLYPILSYEVIQISVILIFFGRLGILCSE